MTLEAIASYCWELCQQFDAVGAGWTQVYAEQALTIRTELDPHGRYQVFAEQLGGVGVTVRDGDSWRYQSAAWNEQQLLLDWAAARFAALPKPPPVPRDSLDTELTELSSHLAAPGWLVTSNVRLLRDHVLRWRAVADSTGTRSSWILRGIRRRAEATVSGLDGEVRGFARDFSPDWSVHERADELAVTGALNQAVRLSAARRMGARRTPVLFAGATAAALLHELVGHRLEADNLDRHTERSLLPGQRIAACALTVDDDPVVAKAYGSIPFDDDGHSSAAVRLVADGVISGRLGCLRYPSPGENRGRRQDYRWPTLPRASNLVVQPGEASMAELTEPPRTGLLIVSALGAAEIDAAAATFALHAVEGRFVDSANQSHPLRDVVLHGDLMSVLGSIEAIGAAPIEVDNGSCLKQGQLIPIGLVAPPIRCASVDWTS